MVRASRSRTPGNDDMQVNGEQSSTRSGRCTREAGHRIAIYGHSQGSMVPRWALRFWPDARAMVDDVVGAAGPTTARSSPNRQCNGTRPCQPSELAVCGRRRLTSSPRSTAGQRRSRGSPTPRSTATRRGCGRTRTGSGASSLHGGGGQITNVAVQDVCPDDTSEHLALGQL